VTMPRVIVFPLAVPDVVGEPPEVADELAALAPAAAVVLDELLLQAVARPDRRVAAAAAASHLLVVGISIETFR
jgi:hypothetical protein